MYPALQVANYFITRGVAARNFLTPMQVLKLVYIAHGWTLGITNEPLINEKVYAWKYGPVIPSIYHAFKERGAEHIKNPLVGYDSDEFDEKVKDVLDFVWRAYGHMSGPMLSAITHATGTPWTANYSAGMANLEIPEFDINMHYKHLLSKYSKVPEAKP